MSFLTTRPQSYLRFQDGGWANWASWGPLQGGRIILALGSSLLSHRIILAIGWSKHWGQIQPFTCKLKAEKIPCSDDPSPRMILALGSSSFHVNGPLVSPLERSTFRDFVAPERRSTCGKSNRLESRKDRFALQFYGELTKNMNQYKNMRTNWFS